jgi:DNA-binding NarL/FixJ family response regulator
MSIDIVNNIIIADSQFLVVEALTSLIAADDRYTLAGVAGNQNDLYKILEVVHSGLLITDFANIDFDGTNDLKRIKQKYPQISILILTNSVNKPEFNGLTKSGIKNIICKTADKDELFSAIESTLKCRKFYSEEILDWFLDLGDNKNIQGYPKHLTTSESDIVKLIATGMTTKEIAVKRNVSYHTVNTHRKNIFKKLEVSNASELILHAIKAGWIDNIEYFI